MKFFIAIEVLFCLIHQTQAIFSTMPKFNGMGMGSVWRPALPTKRFPSQVRNNRVVNPLIQKLFRLKNVFLILFMKTLISVNGQHKMAPKIQNLLLSLTTTFNNNDFATKNHAKLEIIRENRDTLLTVLHACK